MPKMFFRPKPRAKGFTLIELLVAIAIIAILATVGLVTYTGAQKSARNSRRKEDILAITKAMEQTNSGGFYNGVAAANFAGGNIPTDPQNSGTYVYTYSINGGAASSTAPAVVSPPPGTITAFIVCAAMEGGSGGNSSSTLGVAATNGAFYCVKNQQ